MFWEVGNHSRNDCKLIMIIFITNNCFEDLIIIQFFIHIDKGDD
jgi:hypothetical protein